MGQRINVQLFPDVAGFTLPPKPRIGKSKTYQQRIALGIYANHDGVKRAKAEAQRLASDLALGRFDWSYWATLESLRQTCADWIAAFEKEYFTQRARTGKTQTTWDGDYAIPFRRLPAEEDLTAELLVEITTLSTQPDTRARQRAVIAYEALA